MGERYASLCVLPADGDIGDVIYEKSSIPDNYFKDLNTMNQSKFSDESISSAIYIALMNGELYSCKIAYFVNEIIQKERMNDKC